MRNRLNVSYRDPLLFLTYINGLREAIKYSELHHFTYDFNLSEL